MADYKRHNDVAIMWDRDKKCFVAPEKNLKTCSAKQTLFLERAMQLALKSTCRHHRHGCVIVKDNEIVAEGYNHHVMHFQHKMSIHAEVDALSKLKYNRKIFPECEMYVVRIGTDRMGNPLKYSRPCCDCSRAIEKAGVRRVYYSSNEEFEQMQQNVYDTSSSLSYSS